ncbi:MAG: cupin domain-containing protein [Vicinamibacterales bacterium]
MTRTTLTVTTGMAVAAMAGLASIVAEGQAPKPMSVDITATQVQTVVKAGAAKTPPAVDQTLKVVDIGKGGNLAVGIIHRGKTTDTGAVSGLFHSDTTEAYYIVSGGGTLWTDGSIENGKPSAPDSDVTKILNGPSVTGTIKDGKSRVVAPGDIIIIPAGVPHGWTNITDHVDYLSVRPDPNRTLPAGYVNPAIAK